MLTQRHELSASGQALLFLDVRPFTLRSPWALSKQHHIKLSASRVWQSTCRYLFGPCRTWPREQRKSTNYRQVLTSYDQRGGSMERRYLVASLALVATFAIFSREFRSGHLANLPCPRAALKAEIACAKQYLAEQFDAKIRSFVARAIPDEQQMVAELNLPALAAANERVAEVQAKIAERVAEKQSAAARAQDNALRAQERSLRDVERMQERAAELSARATERAQAMNERTTL